MATLLQVRDTVALYGRIELQQLCHKVNDSPAMVQAMLERLEHMGWVTQANHEAENSGCAQGCCQECRGQTTTTCATVIYQIRS